VWERGVWSVVVVAVGERVEQCLQLRDRGGLGLRA
jgi:hypothetical protein